MMREADFVGVAIDLADGSAGAVVRTSPQCARPAPGRTLLLTADGGATIATISTVLAQAAGCGEIVSVVSLQADGTPV